MTKKLKNSLLKIKLDEAGIENQVVNRVFSRVNPLDRLYSSDDLTKDEWFAAKEYQKNHELANISNHARPSYENWGTSKSNKKVDFEPKDYQTRAYAKITKAKLAVSKEYRANEILVYVFENQRSVNWCEKKTGLNHKVIKEKIKTICEILLAI